MTNRIADARDRVALTALARELTQANHPILRRMDARARHDLADVIAAAVRSGYPLNEISERAKALAEEIQQNGFARLGQLITTEAADEVMRYFAQLPCYNSHVIAATHDGVSRIVGQGAEAFPFGCYPMPDIVAAPHVLEIATGDEVLDIVEGYLGARPMLFSLNAYWSFAGRFPPVRGGQRFHRDLSHPRFCVLFIYLTETTRDSGAHEYINGTHSFDRMTAHPGLSAAEIFDLSQDGYNNSELYAEHLADVTETIEGPAGTAFIADAFGLHRGLPPTKGHRLMAWARYSVFPDPPELPKAKLPSMHRVFSERAKYALRALIE